MDRIPFGSRPHYFYGQLLTEHDFLAEQDFHLRAREALNRRLFGAGVVSGLDVHASGETAISVAPGVALDQLGREIRLDEARVVSLAHFDPREVLQVTLHFEEDAGRDDAKHRASYAVLNVVRLPEARSEDVVLAQVTLDDRAKVHDRRIDHGPRRRARIPVESLDARVGEGWVRLPFRPIPLDKDPQSNEELPPPFRVGATETRSHSEIDGLANKKGAGGTMAIAIPSGARFVTAFRIAGAHNSGGIELRLVCGGFDPASGLHVRRSLVGGDKPEIIKAGAKNDAGRTPYNALFGIDDGKVDDEYSTLSLWLRGLDKTAVSLVAVRFAY